MPHWVIKRQLPLHHRANKIDTHHTHQAKNMPTHAPPLRLRLIITAPPDATIRRADRPVKLNHRICRCKERLQHATIYNYAPIVTAPSSRVLLTIQQPTTDADSSATPKTVKCAVSNSHGKGTAYADLSRAPFDAKHTSTTTILTNPGAKKHCHTSPAAQDLTITIHKHTATTKDTKLRLRGPRKSHQNDWAKKQLDKHDDLDDWLEWFITHFRQRYFLA